MNLPLAILSGGLGTRLLPLTNDLPKAMLKICGEPFVHWQITLLAKSGIEKIVYCSGFKSEIIENYLEDGSRYGIEIEFSHDGPEPLGTAGALKKAIPKLGEQFMVIYGDSFLPIDYRAVEKAFELSKKPALMTVFFNEGKYVESNVKFSHGEILKYSKLQNDKEMKYVDYGINCFQSELFSHSRNVVPMDLSEINCDLVEKKQLAGLEVFDRFYEVGSFKGIADFTQYIESWKDVI